MANGEFDPQKIEEFLNRIKQSQNSWKFGAIIILVVLALFLAQSMVYTLQPEQVAVVQRFGKYLDTTGPGLHFKLPWGIDKITKVRTQYVFKEEFGYQTREAGIQTQYNKRSENMEETSLMLTGDLNIADVEWSVQFKIQDPVQFLFKIRDPIGTLRDASQAAMRLVVGDRTVDEVLTFGREEINREFLDKFQALLDEYETGIKVVTVQLQSVLPPESVKESFDDVNKAKQEKETEINQARENENKIIPRALGEAEKLISSAEGYATQRVNEAKGDAERFTQVYRAYATSPGVVKRRLYIESISELLKKTKDVYIVDEKLKNVVPLLQMMNTGTPPAGAKP